MKLKGVWLLPSVFKKKNSNIVEEILIEILSLMALTKKAKILLKKSLS
jgi:hypothetical protein